MLKKVFDNQKFPWRRKNKKNMRNDLTAIK